ncbi:hypothetical protein N7536_008949 [Penicillium majusculum]|nr:hypothetical protein N7536_008949 [Penicillium majusculum]
MTPKSPSSRVPLKRRKKDKEEDEEEERKKKKVVKKKPRKEHVIYRLGIAREEGEGKKSLQKGKKIIIRDGAYTLRSIQFPHFITVLFSLSIPVSLWINRVVVSVRSSTLRTRILRPQFSLFHRAIILNS